MGKRVYLDKRKITMKIDKPIEDLVNDISHLKILDVANEIYKNSKLLDSEMQGHLNEFVKKQGTIKPTKKRF